MDGTGLPGPLDSAMNHPDAQRPELLLLAGVGGSPESLLAAWGADRPVDERWVVVLDESSPRDPATPLPRAEPGLRVTGFAGGCLCCVGSTMLPLFLARQLRDGPWHRLMIALPAFADPAAVIDALLRAPLAQRLGAISVVIALSAGAEASPRWRASADLILNLPAPDRIAPAVPGTDVIRWAPPQTSRGADRVDDPGGDPLVAPIAMRAEVWQAVDQALQAWRNPLRWRWLATSEHPHAARAEPHAQALRLHSPPDRLGWVWPARHRFDRRRMQAALGALAADPAIGWVRAVFRSPRDWHCIDPGERLPSSTPTDPWIGATGSRRESRVECRLRPGVPLDPIVWEQRWRDCLDG